MKNQRWRIAPNIGLKRPTLAGSVESPRVIALPKAAKKSRTVKVLGLACVAVAAGLGTASQTVCWQTPCKKEIRLGGAAHALTKKIARTPSRSTRSDQISSYVCQGPQTLRGSFSNVSRPIFASGHSFLQQFPTEYIYTFCILFVPHKAQNIIQNLSICFLQIL